MNENERARMFANILIGFTIIFTCLFALFHCAEDLEPMPGYAKQEIKSNGS